MNYEEFVSLMENTDWRNYMFYSFYIDDENSPTGIFVSRDNREIHADYEISENEKLYYIDRLSETMTEEEIKQSIVPGTILDNISTLPTIVPEFVVNTTVLEDSVDIQKYCENNKRGKIYDLIDGTTVNLYYLDGWRFSTKNSFDITKMKEYGKSYFEYFMESCEKTSNVINFDELDKSKCYSITFSNPHLHMFSKNYFVHCWSEGLDLCPLEEIKKPSYTTGYIEIIDGKIDIYVTNNYNNMTYTAYHNRRQFSKMSSDNKEIMRRHIWSIMISDSPIIKYIHSKMNRIFNIERMLITRYVNQIQDVVHLQESVGSIKIPYRFRSSRKKETFDEMIRNPDFINFVVKMVGYLDSRYKKN